MRLSGRVSGDEKQQYGLIDEIDEPKKHKATLDWSFCLSNFPLNSSRVV